MGNGASVQKKSPDNFYECYKIIGELGTGAFSVVKRAKQIKSDTEVAVKIVSLPSLSAEDVQALVQEIEILSSLNHPNIIRLFETFEDKESFYIITEIVEGGELFDRIVKKVQYTEREARDLIKVLLHTLAYLADQQVVHRDLKPENLLLCSTHDDANVKIADFGFAKRVKDLKGNETPCGTPGYVSPEILRCNSYGCEVDIWSFGVICYVLLGGYPPFYDDDQKRLFKKIKAGKYHFHSEYWSQTSPDAIDMIKKMLCVKQSDRWTATQLLSHPWILQDDSVLENKSLIESIETMKRFNAKRHFKAAIDMVMITKRLARSHEHRNVLTGSSVNTYHNITTHGGFDEKTIAELSRKGSAHGRKYTLLDLEAIAASNDPIESIDAVHDHTVDDHRAVLPDIFSYSEKARSRRPKSVRKLIDVLAKTEQKNKQDVSEDNSRMADEHQQPISNKSKESLPHVETSILQ